MKTTNKVSSVTERDIDLLLLEELNVSEVFCRWFYNRVTGRRDTPRCEGAWHSVSDAQLGESDLIAIYDNGVVVMLENKIDAAAQPEQGARYRRRGEKGVETLKTMFSRYPPPP